MTDHPSLLPETVQMPAPDPRTHLLGHAMLELIRRHLLQIRAQALQVLPSYDESRPRPSHELGCNLARIVERQHQAVDQIEVALGIRYQCQPRLHNPSAQGRLSEGAFIGLQNETREALYAFRIGELDAVQYGYTAQQIIALAARAASRLLEYAAELECRRTDAQEAK